MEQDADDRKDDRSTAIKALANAFDIKLDAVETPDSHMPSEQLLETRAQVAALIEHDPYSFPLYLLLAHVYQLLRFPDLATGAAYKALLLSDAVKDESDEYHEQAGLSLDRASTALRESRLDVNTLTDDSESSNARFTDVYVPAIYDILIRSLLNLDCYKSAAGYGEQAHKLYPDQFDGESLRRHISALVASRTSNHSADANSWPDQGLTRQELYPWNQYEPDRFQELAEINEMMQEVAPKLEVLAVDLPLLHINAAELQENRTIKQLGVFAKEDITPGQIILSETSILTANNKLQDALCDACSADLPPMGDPNFDNTVSCSECEVVFCSQECHDIAAEKYHAALCDMDVEAIARDVPPAESANALYSLLLLRAFAMAETQQCHPLELPEVKYIWGDLKEPQRDNSSDDNSTRTLPFSFEYNIRLPFHMLEKMDIDIFRNPQYDVWVFNTLYAKFRGTASARLSGLGGTAIRGPEVSAVHPMWCMANHSCDPNVSWEWGGSINFWARKERVAWRKDGEKEVRSQSGIRKGEEVFNHYCDVDLDVKDRREWARGALGGNCRCARCVWEANEMP